MKNFIKENTRLGIMLGLAILFFVILHFVFKLTILPIEIASVILGITSLDLGRRQKVSSFFFNIAFCVLLALWFLGAHLYGQVIMRSFLAVVNIIGIYFWLRPDKNKKLLQPSNFLPATRFVVYGVLGFAVFVLLFNLGLVKTFDYTSAGLIILGTILMTRKKVDAWICFLVADCASLVLFPVTGQYAYIAFACCAIYNEIGSIKDWGQLARKN